MFYDKFIFLAIWKPFSQTTKLNRITLYDRYLCLGGNNIRRRTGGLHRANYSHTVYTRVRANRPYINNNILYIYIYTYDRRVYVFLESHIRPRINSENERKILKRYST